MGWSWNDRAQTAAARDSVAASSDTNTETDREIDKKDADVSTTDVAALLAEADTHLGLLSTMLEQQHSAHTQLLVRLKQLEKDLGNTVAYLGNRSEYIEADRLYGLQNCVHQTIMDDASCTTLNVGGCGLSRLEYVRGLVHHSGKVISQLRQAEDAAKNSRCFTGSEGAIAIKTHADQILAKKDALYAHLNPVSLFNPKAITVSGGKIKSLAALFLLCTEYPDVSMSLFHLTAAASRSELFVLMVQKWPFPWHASPEAREALLATTEPAAIGFPWDVVTLRHVGFDLPTLRALRYSNQGLQVGGYTVSQFKEADVPIPELLPIFPLTCMLSEGHYSPADLKLKGGVTADDAFRGSVSLASLGQVYDPAELVAAGYDVAAIVSECGFSGQQMKHSFYKRLTGHTKSVVCVCVLPDGRVVSGSHDKTLRLWNPDTGARKRTLTGHTDSVSCVCVLPDGRVVSGSWYKTLRVRWFIEA